MEVAVLLCVALLCGGCLASNDETSILQDLGLSQQNVSKYDPGRSPSGRTVTRIAATVSKVNSFDTVAQTYKIIMYFRHTWTDTRLRWDPNAYGNVTSVKLGEERVWKPDTFFSSASEIEIPEGEQYTYIFNTGEVRWSRRLIITFFCDMEFHYFPFDSQECIASAESYAYTDEYLVLDLPQPGDTFPEALEFPTDQRVGPYSLGNPVVSRATAKQGTRTYSAITYQFHFKRRVEPYIINTFLPLWLVVSLSHLGLWVNPEAAPARVAMGITTILALLQLMFILTREVPKVSYITAMDVYFLLCIVVVVANMAEYTLINYLNTCLSVRMQKIETRKRHCKGAAAAMRRTQSAYVGSRNPMMSSELNLPPAQGSSAPYGEAGSEGDSTSDIHPGNGHNGSALALEAPPSPTAMFSTTIAEQLKERRMSRYTMKPPPSTTGSRERIVRHRVKMQVAAEKAREADLREAFNAFDRDKTGQLTPEELMPLLLSLGLTPEATLDIIEKADLDGDGEIDFKEFRELMKLCQNSDLLGETRSIIICGLGVSSATVRHMESVYRLVSPSVFVCLTAVWFGVVLGTA